MRKFLGSVAALIVLLVAAVLIGPGLIDWNSYKGDILRQVKAATGRDLAIGGDIRITVLPAPAFVASDVALANPEGATSPHMARLKSIEVRVALAPLLSGQIKVQTVRLIEPVIELEVLSDGRGNWEFPALSDDGGQAASGAGQESAAANNGAGGDAVPAVALDNFTIDNGTLIYRDAGAGLVERVERISATISAASLKGPLQSTGALTVRGVPLDYELDVGEIIHQRTVPIGLTLSIKPGQAKVQVSGTILGLEQAPRFKGSVKAAGADLAAMIGAVSQGGPIPGILGQAFTAESEISVSSTAIDSKNLTFGLGETRASGDLTVDLGETMRIAARLTSSRIDLDKWLAESKNATASSTQTASAGTSQQTEITAELPPPGASAKTGMLIPDGVIGSVILSVDTVNYRDGLIGDVLLNAELANGKVTINQFSAQFPGGSDLTLFGAVSVADGAPRFDGEVETTVNDLRGVLNWLGNDLGQVPTDRLRKLSLGVKIGATTKLVKLAGLDLRFDSSRLTGGVTVALRSRPSFGANLVLDRINVDAYLPKPVQAGSASTPAAGTAQGSTAQQPASSSGQSSPIAALSGLKSFDANVKTRIKTLVYQGTQIRDFISDATLYNGDLEIRRLSVAKIAGTAINIGGKISNIAGLPSMKSVKVSVQAKNPSRLFRLAGIETPFDPKKLGAIGLKGVANGSFLKPKLDFTLTGGGATVGVKGSVSALSLGGDMLDAAVSVKHKDVVRLIGLFGSDYRPAGPLGALDIAAKVRGGLSNISLSDLNGRIGRLNLGGQAAVDLAGVRPKLTAALKTGAVVIDPFLPAKKSAALEREPAFQVQRVPVAWPGPSATGGQNPLLRLAATAGRWPNDAIDLSVLRDFDANVSLQAPVVVYGKILIEKADIAAVIADGVLSTQRLKGVVFGGALDAGARVEAGTRNRLRTAVQLRDVDIAEATRSLTGKPNANGTMNVDFDLTSTGRSVAEFVSTLVGSGTFALQNVDVQKVAPGSAMAGVFGLITAFNQIGGGKTGGRAKATGSFQMTNGVAQSRDLVLTSGVGNANAAGSVNLPKWTVDVRGKMKLAETLLTQILKTKVREAGQEVAFAVQGSLDHPNIKVDTGALLGGGVPIPGANLLLNKAPKGVGGLIQGILGGGASTQTQPSQPPPPQTGTQTQQQPPPPPDTQQQKKLKPEDLLKKLLNF